MIVHPFGTKNCDRSYLFIIEQIILRDQTASLHFVGEMFFADHHCHLVMPHTQVKKFDQLGLFLYGFEQGFHFIKVGNGKINNIESNYHETNDDQDLQIDFDYLYALGDTRVSILLTSSNTFPKPAAYAINGQRADRHVELPNYLISLRSAEHQLPVEDPLVCSIKNFISTIHSKASSDEVALIDGITHLAQIYQVVTQH